MSNTDEDLKVALQRLLLNSSKQFDSNEPESNTLELLKQKAKAFLEEPEDFKQGDIVKWKKGLKNRRYPKENQPCYVIDVLKTPLIQDTRDSGSPYYNEPLDLVLALLSDDSELLVFYYDKRRFELIKS